MTNGAVEIASVASARHLGRMGWIAAQPIVRTLTVATFVGVSAACAMGQFKPENPQPILLAVASLGSGAIVATIVLFIGEFLSRRSTGSALGHAFSRDSYTRQTMPLLLLLGILAAVFTMLALHLIEAVRHGNTLSGWTAAVLAAILFYPFIRYRIERGRWPD